MGFVDDVIDVGADVQRVYDRWLDYESYPRFMAWVEDVAVVGYCRLRWKGRVCGVLSTWESDIVSRVEDTRVRWQAADGREMGEVTLEKLEAGETRVRYQLEFEAAAWGAGEAALERCMRERVRGDLRAFKALTETADGA
jgi:uncharacterized membrane protein